MAKLSLSEVSNRFNVSRSTLYRAIKEGRISRSSDGLFDIAEVIRCFGEPIKKHEQKQEVNQSKDDADLRQLVDFMKKEIESYKDREKRYLDQIDRFQLLLGHKESEEKMSHDAPVTHPMMHHATTVVKHVKLLIIINIVKLVHLMKHQ